MENQITQPAVYSPRQHYDLAQQCGYRYRDLQIDGRARSSDDAMVMMQGQAQAIPVHTGMTLMLSDVTHFYDFSAEAEMTPGLLVGVSLAGLGEGEVEGVGVVEAATGQALSLNMGRSTLFSGQQRKGQRYTTVSVYVTADWLDLYGLMAASTFTGNGHVAAHTWYPSLDLRHQLGFLLQGASAGGSERAAGPLERLTRESLSLDLVRLGVRPFLEGFSATDRLPPGDWARMDRVRDCMLANPGADHSLAALARDAGVSVTVLKEKYRLAFGETVFETLRSARLELGQYLLAQGMALSQVSLKVGYAHPANFTTAYKRYFGFSPRRHL